MVFITAFEVPVQADDRFIAGWERERPAATLHRALRRDVRFRFVSVAGVADTVELPFDTHSGRYEIAHEDGTAMGTQGVTLINPFEVAPDDDEAFLAGWNRAREAVAGCPDYLGTRLHRAVGAADFRFVNVARWSSPLAFSKAIGRPEFEQTAAAMPFASHPALYTVVSD
ncbi:MAG TPA: antibiotic biosynthesis monooxygenase [Acidimicrobiia bacterium]|nr:antibiotic biosynthesis monooxygenase [Acidimicrobiia bacterium]